MNSPTAILGALNLDPDLETPLYRQLYDSVRSAILSGRLLAGLRMPPSRTLAKELAIGRNTVVAAYEQLIAEGYLESRVGSGTHVAAIPPDTLIEAGRAERQEIKPDPRRRLSQRGEAMLTVKRASPSYVKGHVLPFQHGMPSLEFFPHQVWARLLARRARQPQSRLFDYQLGTGFPALREAIAEYLGAARGVVCGPDNVIVTAGAQASLDLATRLVVDPGDVVWHEEPGYLGARGAFLASSARIVPVPVDEEGMNPDAAPPGEDPPRLIYCTPSHQYPLSVTMSLKRRLALLQKANEVGAWILEDDYDSEFRYAGRPLSSLQGLDRTGGVIYMGTMAKTLFPAIRIGYLVVPDNMVEACLRAIRVTGQNPPAIVQAAVADFMHEGHFSAHIRRMRALYAERRDLLIDALESKLGGRIRPARPDGGMQLPAFLPEGVSDDDATAAADRHKVLTTAVSHFYLTQRKRHALYLGFAGVPEKLIEPGVERLSAALHEVGV